MEIIKKHNVDFTRIFDIIAYQREKYPNAHSLNAFSNGQWRSISITELQERVDAMSGWLVGQGFAKGDKVIFMPIMGTPQWIILDFACQQIGLIVVPVHPTLREEEMETILLETEPKLFISANVGLFEKSGAAIRKLSIRTDLFHLSQGVPGYFEALDLTKNINADALKTLRDNIREDDIFTILYTSGSSGVPKGVMLTHRNVVHNIKAILTLLPLEPGERVLSFLPFSHIFERTTSYGYLAFGVSLYFSQTKDSFAHDFKSVRPVFCTSVPRVLEKMYDFMQEQLLRKNFIQRQLIRWAMKVGRAYDEGHLLHPLFALQLFLARILVLSQWRHMLGGKIRYMVVGAASLQPEIGRLFSAAGIKIVEGYGMTETSPIITLNRYEPGQNRFGTVGIAIAGVEIKIDQPNEDLEGEILVKGANVTQGYFKKPELTSEAFTSDGWFKTGDIGKWEHQRFLKITDRKKDIFKTSAGKYIAPMPLQNHFAGSPFIQRCLVLGFQRPYVTALIMPHFAILEAWCREEGIHWTSPAFMVHNIKVRAKMQQEIDRLNQLLPNFQRVRNFILCHEEWSIENGEITNTLKPVRHRLVEHYQSAIEKMYTETT